MSVCTSIYILYYIVLRTAAANSTRLLIIRRVGGQPVRRRPCRLVNYYEPRDLFYESNEAYRPLAISGENNLIRGNPSNTRTRECVRAVNRTNAGVRLEISSAL